MADFTIQIREEVASGFAAGTKKHALALLKGDIVDVRPIAARCTFNDPDWNVTGGLSNGSVYYIHALDVPGTVSAVMQNLARPFTVSVPQEGDPDNRELWRPSQFRFRVALLSTPRRNEVIANREITLDWPAVRGAIEQKSATDELDRSTDVYTAVTNQDIIDSV